MKTIRLLAVLLACIATSAIAQTPDNIQAAFKSKYPNATLKKLKQHNANYVATFTDNGKKCKAFFNDNGKWLKTETAMKWKTLPDIVREGLVKSKYCHWLIENVDQVQTPQKTMYSIEVDNEYTLSGDTQYAFAKTCYVYYTPSGNFIKEVDLK